MKVTEWISLFVFPPRCPGCGQLLPALPTAAARQPLPLLCETCGNVWKAETNADCPLCVKPMHNCTCAPKICVDNGCDTVRKLFQYRPHHTKLCTSRVIFSLKEHLTRRVTNGAAQAFLPAVDEICAERGIKPGQAVITFLPRRRAAKAAYGFDQAEKLAYAIARVSGAVCLPLLARSGSSASKAQKQLNRQGRMKAAAAAFKPTGKQLPAGTGVILLVDDIITTGSGIAAGSAILKKQYGLPMAALVLGMTYQQGKNHGN